MTSILNRVFVRAGKVLSYHVAKNRSTLYKINEIKTNALSTVTNFETTTPIREEFEDDELLFNEKSEISVLEEPKKLPDLSHITPQLRPSLNFAYYANKSEVIQQLIKLGVDFHKIEQRKRLPEILLQLDFETDVKPYISFLFEQGVPADQLGRFFTKNPFLFEESLDDLQVRINYLLSKKFDPDMISRIITINPRWLNKTTKKIDEILGNFQTEFHLTGEEIRYVVCKRPAIVAIPKFRITDNKFLFKYVMEFTWLQIKELFLKQPYIWSHPRSLIQEKLDIMLRDMELTRSMIVSQPQGLTCRAFKLKERHLFLKELGKAQYDPTKPGYVSLKDISVGNDATFCQNVAKTSVETFNLFLKSL